jgi:hypothetical protein
MMRRSVSSRLRGPICSLISARAARNGSRVRHSCSTAKATTTTKKRDRDKERETEGEEQRRAERNSQPTGRSHMQVAMKGLLRVPLL